MRSTIDTYRRKEISDFGMALQLNESEVTKAIKTVKALCAHTVTITIREAEAHHMVLVSEAETCHATSIKEVKANHPSALAEAEDCCSTAIREAES